MRRRWLFAAVPLGLVALVSVGTWVYINVIEGDAPARLTLEASDDSSSTSSGTAPDAGPAAGSWKIARGSEAGYRVKEVLFGQSTTAVGRTTAVTGRLEIVGTSVTTGRFTVDMTTVSSDQSRRDGQFHGRIMETATHPTATFVLTKAIDLGSEPAAGKDITAAATGVLTLHGMNKAVSFDVTAVRTSAGIRVAGSIPVVFADYGVPNPSNMAVTTEDHGELEFRLTLVRA